MYEFCKVFGKIGMFVNINNYMNHALIVDEIFMSMHFDLVTALCSQLSSC